MCDCNVRCDPVRVQGLTAAVLEAGCQLLLIAGCRETLRIRGDARGVQRASEAPDGQDHDLPGYDARRVLRENRDCAQSLFLKYSWKSGGADMLSCVTTLKYKGLETPDLEFKWCQRLGQDLQNGISGKDSFWAAVGARGRSTSM